ncbi:hypothetical protein ACFVHB_28545 [Kitasatospora sp. NPDC127111]|uniref:hypothetical protein n=1 Tax=Kitasatospora sp. NPDC127111 TaxID=3345363 RepID=UPI0036291FEE
MSIPFYVPAFTHQDWIDNQDRVQAGGEKGLNIRFHNLEAEFRRLADFHLNEVIRTVAPAQRCLSLAPLLTFNGGNPGIVAWVIIGDLAQKPVADLGANGIMNVTLPDGVTITSLTVTGEAPDPLGDVRLSLALRSKAVDESGTVKDIAQAVKFNTAFPALETTVVKNTDNKYFIEASVSKAANVQVKIFCFQIRYQ